MKNSRMDKPLYDLNKLGDAEVTLKISKLSPKVANTVRKSMATGGSTNKPKPVKPKPKPNNVIPFPDKPGNMGLWWKKASAEDIMELLNPVYSEKALEGLSDTELKELLQYTIDTGGIG